MRFVNKWSYACARGLAEVLNENHPKRAAYYYGFQIVIGGIVKFGILVASSLLLGILKPMIVVTLAFVLFRWLAGGYHMDTYGKCLFVSLGLFVGAALIAKYTYSYWSIAQLIILIGATFIFGLYIIKRYAPRDTPNKPITDIQEIRKFKTLSFAYLFIWLILISLLTAAGLKIYTISLGFGVLLELFAVSTLGHKFFDLIQYGTNKKTAG